MTDASLDVSAPAKLNLALSVGAPAPDGLHPICSWMVTIDFCDELQVWRLPPDRFSRYAIRWHEDARRPSDIDWSITGDLAVRAHLALERHVGRKLPVQLKLEKRIPVGSGLGGGSSDAAAMLHAVNRLYELRLDTDELATLGAALGADVPFLVHGGSALVEGRGERITPCATAPALHAVLVLPDARCRTGEVYDLFDELGGGELRVEAVRRLVGSGSPIPVVAPLFNDLAPAAIRLAPTLGDTLDRVAAIAERPAHVSGSGSSLFVVCDDALRADHLAAAIERAVAHPALAVRGVDRTGAPSDARDVTEAPIAPETRRARS